MANHHGEEGWPPAVTTPQGMQSPGLLHGHEETDISLAAVLEWFGILAVFTALTFLAVWGAYRFWANSLGASAPLPSSVFAERMVPPEPRILPNVYDSRERPLEGGPGQALQAHRRAEEERLRELNLLDEEGQPRVPLAAIRSVIATYAAEPAGSGPGTPQDLQNPMPSDPSGGTVTENRVR